MDLPTIDAETALTLNNALLTMDNLKLQIQVLQLQAAQIPALQHQLVAAQQHWPALFATVERPGFSLQRTATGTFTYILSDASAPSPLAIVPDHI